MGAKNQFGALGDFFYRLNEPHPPPGKFSYHVFVVNNFVKYIQRRTMPLERPFHRLNCHLHSSTKTPGAGQYDFLNAHGSSLEKSWNAVNHCVSSATRFRLFYVGESSNARIRRAAAAAPSNET